MNSNKKYIIEMKAKQAAMGHVFYEIPDEPWEKLFDIIIDGEAEYKHLDLVSWEPYERYTYDGICVLLVDTMENFIRTLNEYDRYLTNE